MNRHHFFVFQRLGQVARQGVYHLRRRKRRGEKRRVRFARAGEDLVRSTDTVGNDDRGEAAGKQFGDELQLPKNILGNIRWVLGDEIDPHPF